MIKEPVGSTMGFSGGAEQTPIVTIGHKANELALRCYVYGRADREVVLTESEAPRCLGASLYRLQALAGG